MTSRSRSRWTSIGCLLAATAIWLPIVHLCFRPSPASHPPTASGLSPWVSALAARQVHLWTDPQARKRELDRMRRSNAEWDFMGRTFLALALAEMSVSVPNHPRRPVAVFGQQPGGRCRPALFGRARPVVGSRHVPTGQPCLLVQTAFRVREFQRIHPPMNIHRLPKANGSPEPPSLQRHHGHPAGLRIRLPVQFHVRKPVPAPAGNQLHGLIGRFQTAMIS